MAVDLEELIRLLEQVPEQRAALRRAIMGDQPDLASALSSLAQRVEALTSAQQRTEQRLEALAAAQQRTEQRVDSLAQHVDSLAKDLRELAQAQRMTESKLGSLIDTVRGMHDRVAKLDGDALERRYREKGVAYFARIARRLHHIDVNVLSPLIDDAEQAGRLSPLEANSLLQADAVFSGRRRDDGTPVHLVVEASVTIAYYDVSRARERADLFARVVDTPVIAVVAGEFAPRPVVVAAQDAEVWCVTNGTTVAPADDLDR